MVKLWDCDRKKGWSFRGHQNKVQHVLIWDDFSVLSAGIDRSIRYFDLRDWSSEVETEDVETLNGFHFSKLFRGHTKSITHLKRLNNSHSRIISASEDSTIKIWDLNSNIYCDLYSNSNVVGHRLNQNTEIVEPLETIEGTHQSGIKAMAINQSYLASFSQEDGCISIRDWERVDKPLIIMRNFNDILHYNEQQRGDQPKFKNNSFNTTTMDLCPRDQHLLITTESRRVRVWDLREPLKRTRVGAVASQTFCIQDRQSARGLKATYCDVNTANKGQKDPQHNITTCYKTIYQPTQNRLLAAFVGSHGIHSFDLRKAGGSQNAEQIVPAQSAYYNLHSYQISDFDVGTETLSDYALSVAVTKEYRYDIRPINLLKDRKDQNTENVLYPGHKVVITKLRQNGDLVVTGDKKGELKVMKFGLFKGDLSKAPSCIKIKNESH